MNNQIFAITPYKYNGIWVFDDERVGLVKEAFVAGMDLILDKLTEDIENAENGFNLIFSHEPFPGYDVELNHLKVEENLAYGGNWYHWEAESMTGWLCPALFLYYPTAPEKLFAQAKQKS